MKPNFSPISPGDSLQTHKRNLPHWEQTGRIYFLTWRLADSIPQQKIKELSWQKRTWLSHHPEPWDEESANEYHHLFTARWQRWLDQGHGSCLLNSEVFRKITESSLHYFDGTRYFLDDYVLMPNHVHVLVMPNEAFQISEITHSWKSFSAHEMCKLTDHKGPIWMKEGFDTMVRSMKQLDRFRSYIRNNPENAHLDPIQYTLGKGRGIPM